MNSSSLMELEYSSILEDVMVLLQMYGILRLIYESKD